jgi:hypothetical protein
MAVALLPMVDRHGTSREDELSATVRATLTTKARDALEGGASSYLTPESGRLACAAHVLGTNPPGVTEPARARIVYVWAMCATVGTAVSTESSLPAAVHLDDPPTAEVPGDGSLNEPDLQRIFPRRLWGVIDDDQDRFALEPQMRRRVHERA